MCYEIFVYGLDVDDIESIGGWQLFFKTFNKEVAKSKYVEYCEMYGNDDVMIYVNGKVFYRRNLL